MNFNEWLESVGLGKHADALAANDIDEVEILADLNDAELEALGIPIGGRKKIERALAGLGLRSDEAQAASPQAVPPKSTPSPIPEQLPSVPQTHDQQPEAVVVPAEAPQLVEPQPARSESTPHLAPPASSPQAQAVQATRNQPKAKNSRKATAITIAVGVHVAIILLATTLTIFAASKDEPEIIASIAPPAATPQQEMKKKTVQKQVKRAPSAASAAAAPMAIMMKANAEARFTTPDVTRTSTGPLGMGEGDVGAGAFGVGTGLGDAGAGGGAMFMGTKTKGRTAVIFDVSKSMFTVVPQVVQEIKRAFADAQVVAALGCPFQERPKDGEKKLTSYQRNEALLTRLNRHASAGGAEYVKAMRTMNESLFSLKNCISLSVVGGEGGNNLQNIGRVIELLLEQPDLKRPATIFIFADFLDPVDRDYLKEIQTLVKAKGTKVVFWCPFGRIPRKEYFDEFVAGISGGEVKMDRIE